MTESHISAHNFDYPKAQLRLTVLERTLPVAIENRAKLHDNLGAAVDNARSLVGFRQALERPRSEVVDALRLVCDLGVALYRRAQLDREATIVLPIGGQQVEVPGGSSFYNSAPRWADAVGAAMTLRDSNALKQLCAFDAAGFLGSYDTYHDIYARAVMAFVAGREDWDPLLAEASRAADNAPKFPERGRRYGVPLTAVAKAAMRREEGPFNQSLAEGLEGYRTLYSRAPDKQNPKGVLPLRYLGWSAHAHDSGIGIRVRSDYLPPWLVDGSFRDAVDA